MNRTKKNDAHFSNMITANTETLAESLDCGRSTAVKIGEAAGAKIQIGKRVLWNVRKIRNYLDGIASE